MLDALGLQRAAHYLKKRGVPLIPRLFTRLVVHLYGSVLSPDTEFPEGTVLGYGGLNVVVHRDTRLGKRVVISQGVTIGGTGTRSGVPVIGDDVRIGAGAKILGPVHIGRGARIGANAVVTRDVAAYRVAVGVPARELPLRDSKRDASTGFDEGEPEDGQERPGVSA
jgi:serine O-acetyltransferase